MLEICLGDAEVDVAHVETMEGNGVWMVTGRGAGLAVLLGLGGLHDDGNT